MTVLKFFAYTDFIDPAKLLASGLEMTRLAYWMWNIVAVLIFECAMVLTYAVLFEDGEGHEVVVTTMAVSWHLMKNCCHEFVCSLSYAVFVPL